MNWLKKIFTFSSDEDKWAGTPYATGAKDYASPKLVEQLEQAQKGQRAFVKDFFDGRLTGGPGFTQKSAWVVEFDNGIAVECEYKTLWELFNKLYLTVDGVKKEIDIEPLRQELRQSNGHHYDVHIINVHLTEKTYMVEQWFDISKYYDNPKKGIMIYR